MDNHPTIGGNFHKPRNARRKLCNIHRKKAKEPDIVVDRLSISSTFWPASSPTITAASTLISTSVSTKSTSTSASTSTATSISTFKSTFSAQPSASNDKESEVRFMDPTKLY